MKVAFTVFSVDVQIINGSVTILSVKHGFVFVKSIRDVLILDCAQKQKKINRKAFRIMRMTIKKKLNLKGFTTTIFLSRRVLHVAMV